MRTIVLPSAGAFAAASQAMRPPAPVRFSTTNVLPVSSVILLVAMRV